MKWIDNIRWLMLDKSASALRVRQISKIVLLVVLLGALFWVIPIDRVVFAILGASISLLILGFLIQIPATFLNAYQLLLIIKKQSITLGLFQVWVINMAIKFYTLFMQGTLAATGIRWYKLSQKDNKPAEALASVAFYRLIQTFLAIALGLTFWFFNSFKPIQINALLLGIILIAITLFWFGITRLSLPLLSWLKKHMAHFFEKSVGKIIYSFTEKIFTALAAFSNFSAWELFLVIAVGICQQLVGAISNYYFAQAIGINIPMKDMIWISAVVVLISQLPIAIAGGLGVREVSLVALMASFGIKGETALAFSFLLFLRGFVLSLMGGLLELFQTISDKPEVKSIIKASKE